MPRSTIKASHIVDGNTILLKVAFTITLDSTELTAVHTILDSLVASIGELMSKSFADMLAQHYQNALSNMTFPIEQLKKTHGIHQVKRSKPTSVVLTATSPTGESSHPFRSLMNVVEKEIGGLTRFAGSSAFPEAAGIMHDTLKQADKTLFVAVMGTGCTLPFQVAPGGSGIAEQAID